MKELRRVEVWLYQTSVPLVFSAQSTYQKGGLFCVYDVEGRVTKFPIQHIFRVVEDYDPSPNEPRDA